MPPQNTPLIRTLIAFVTAPDWGQTQLLLTQHPELLTKEAEALLQQIINDATADGAPEAAAQLNEHLKLLRHSKEIGVDQAFAEKMFAMHQMADARLEDFKDAREITDRQTLAMTPAALTEAINARQTLLDRPSVRASHKLYHNILSEQGLAYGARFEVLRDPADVEMALTCQREVITAFPETSLDWAYAQGNHARALRLRYDVSRDVADLDQAIAGYQRALQVLTTQISPRSIFLGALGYVYSLRFNHSGNLADLDSATTNLQEAISLGPPGSVNWAKALNSLGVVLLSRFKATGKPEDINGAVEAHRDSLNAISENPGQTRLYQGHLATALAFRFDVSQDPSDLYEAFTAITTALETTPPGSFEWARWQNTLGLLLHRQFDHTNDLADLEASVEAYRRALSVSGEDSPNWIVYHANLQEVLRHKFKITGDVHELDVAVEAAQNAISNSPPGSPFRAGVQSALSSALRARFEATGQQEDLERSIRTVEDATQVPLNSPAWAEQQASLGRAFVAQFEKSGKADDIEKAIECFVEASNAVPHLPRNRASYESNLGSALWLRFQVTLNAADLDKAIEATRRAVGLVPSGTLEWARMLGNLALELSARFTATQRRADIDEAAESMRRALKICQPGSFEEARWLNMYGHVLLQRHRGVGDLPDLNQAIVVFEQALAALPSNSGYRAQWQSNLAEALLHRFVAVGKREDAMAALSVFERALAQLDPQLSPRLVLDTAKSYGNLLFAHSRWEEAARVCGIAAHALSSLYRTQSREQSRSSWLAQSGDVPTMAAYAMARVGRLREAAVMIETGRARSLNESLARNRTDLEDIRNIDAGAYDEYQNAAGNLNLAEAREREIAFSGESDLPQIDSATFRVRLQQTREKLDQAIQRIRRIPGYSDFLAEPDWDDVAKAVQPDVPVIYLLATVAGSLVLILHRSSAADAEVSIDSIWLDDFSEVDLRLALNEWSEAYEEWKKDPRQKRKWIDAIDRVTGVLGSSLMQAIARQVLACNARQAIFIPCGLWPLLPLHAAWTEADGKRSYVMDEVVFTYSPSALALAFARSAAETVTAGELLMVMDPSPIETARPLPNLQLGRLAIESCFETSLLLAGESATCERVTQELAGADVVHFACHGESNWDDPLASGLLMANDEMLTVRDLIEIRLEKARLATLAACETGVIGTQLPDEVIALPSAFMRAGFAGVVASLWAVTDVSTALLMKDFYKLWKQDQLCPAMALNESQKNLRAATAGDLARMFVDEQSDSETGIPRSQATLIWRWLNSFAPDECPFAHPYYWAAFMYTGV